MSKYGNKETVIDGIRFQSRKEAYRWCDLRLLQRAGKISELKRQVKYVLIPSQRDESGKLIEREVSYYADFVYKNANGSVIVEDVKGYKRGAAYQLFSIKRKLMLFLNGIKVKEI